jgi:hypothetical protein
MPSTAPRLLGVDFTCAPSRRKPLTVAHGRLVDGGAALRLDGVDALTDWAAFDALLRGPGPWVGAFDFPFGWPRAFVDGLGLGRTTAEVVATLRARCPDRRALQALIDAWTAGRPPGRRLPHRATDTALDGAPSTSPLQTRYVPVAFMAFEGMPRLLAAGVHLPGLHAGDPDRVALEGYPGALARAHLGRRSYKNAPTAERRAARAALLDALSAPPASGHPDAVPRLQVAPRLRPALLDDASGDRLDAVLCLAQAARAASRPGWGLPEGIDPVEGWIVGARAPSSAGGAPTASSSGATAAA